MNREEFQEAVEAKFDFNDGYYQKDDFVLTTQDPGYKMAYDGPDDDPSNPHIEIDDDYKGYGQAIDCFEEFGIEDPERFFSARSIVTSNSEEYVHIEEPGKWADHVFLNFHDEGLFSLEDLEDEYDWIADEYDTAEERIENVPFFQNPVAKSLREFFDLLVEVSKDEFRR